MLCTSIQREERFVRQASGGVQYIVESTLVSHGGPTMLSIQAMASILQLPGVKVRYRWETRMLDV